MYRKPPRIISELVAKSIRHALSRPSYARLNDLGGLAARAAPGALARVRRRLVHGDEDGFRAVARGASFPLLARTVARNGREPRAT